MDKPTLELKGIHHSFRIGAKQKLKVLSDLNLNLYSDEVVAILGPSGSGKSTCLRIMAGLIQPGEGEVFVEGNPLKAL